MNTKNITNKNMKHVWDDFYSQKKDVGIFELQNIVDLGYFETPKFIIFINKIFKKTKKGGKK